MIRAIKNLYFAATAQPDRLDPQSSTWYGWQAAYLVSMIALLNSPYVHLVALPLNAGLAAAIMSKVQGAKVNYEKLIIASLGTLLPLLMASILEAHALIVIALAYVGVKTLSAIILENAKLPPATQISSADADSLRRLRAGSAAVFVEMGPVIGKFRNVDIPAWFRDDQGRTHEFIAAYSGSTPPKLEEGESLVVPGLIYRVSSDHIRPPG